MNLFVFVVIWSQNILTMERIVLAANGSQRFISSKKTRRHQPALFVMETEKFPDIPAPQRQHPVLNAKDRGFSHEWPHRERTRNPASAGADHRLDTCAVRGRGGRQCCSLEAHVRWTPPTHLHRCEVCARVYSCSCPDSDAYHDGTCTGCAPNDDPVLMLTETDQEILQEWGIIL